MSKNTQILIDQLSKDLTPVKRVNLKTLFLVVLVVSVISVGLQFAFFHSIRRDLEVVYLEPHFILIVLGLLGVAIAAIQSALILSSPGKIRPRWIFIVERLSWTAVIVGTFWQFASGMSVTEHFRFGLGPAGASCATLVVVAATLPGMVFFGVLKNLAPLSPQKVGKKAAVAAGVFGALAAFLHCPTDEAVHSLVWHISPIVMIAGLGFFLGTRILRWND